MNFKFALAAAAVVGLAGTAQAADLAKKAPAAANYVKVCDAYGAGYFYIPGSETCLKIGGYVRAEVRTGNIGSYKEGTWGTVSGINQSQRSKHGVYTRARADLTFDARTATEMGLLRSFIEIYATNNSGNTGAPSGLVNLRQAFIQFAGLTAGRATSFFDFVPGGYNYGIIEVDSADHRANLLGYTFSFGNGISASLAIEDQSTADFGVATYDSTYYGGVKYPDLVANVAIAQAWGKAQISGALHSDYAATPATDKWGFAVGAGVEVNLPMIAAGDKAFIQGVYSQGAVGYAVINAPGGISTKDFLTNGTGIELTKAWSISAGFHHEFTKQWEANLGASYANVDQFGDADYNVVVAGADLRWKPASGFHIGVGVDYVDYNFTSATKAATANAGLHDTSGWIGTLRVQRSF